MLTTQMKRYTCAITTSLFALNLGCGISGDDRQLRFGTSGFGAGDEIAIGATLRLSATDMRAEDGLSGEAGEEVELVSVTSSDPLAVAVQNVDASSVSLLGASLGSSEIEFTATNQITGETLVDTLTFEVVVPDAIEIWPSCNRRDGERSALYLPGYPIHLDFRAMNAEGRVLFGEGYDPLEPGTLTGATFESSGGSVWGPRMYLRAGDASGDVSFELNVGEHDLDLEVIAASSIDGATTIPLYPSASDTDEHYPIYVDEEYGEYNPPSRQPIRVAPTRQRDAVCSSVAVTSVSSLTPLVCDAVTSDEDEATRDLADSLNIVPGTMLGIEAKAVGACELDVTFEGAATPARVSVQILEQP